MSLSKTHYNLVKHRKTGPDITVKMLTGVKIIKYKKPEINDLFPLFPKIPRRAYFIWTYALYILLEEAGGSIMSEKPPTCVSLRHLQCSEYHNKCGSLLRLRGRRFEPQRRHCILGQDCTGSTKETS